MSSEQHVLSREKNDILHPPGGILIWILIFLEVITFMIALSVFAYMRSRNAAMFAESQAMLNPLLGTVNTIVLLSSGYFMAEAVRKLRAGLLKLSVRYTLVTILLGLVFIAIKSFEYSQKIEHGIGLEYNTFFTFYWLLTGFHLIHVSVGIVILVFIYFSLRKGRYDARDHEDVETGAAFWHMCDLIWMLLFPMLYLIN
ncbi:MAG TPA: cytochrome c oxidase subunit 3 family protein [Caldithrix abyssi]|uniref:Cytochrome c oxidase subunit 3 family protein n=1 Tax=Caldithrix abyssi TaxID=187145 RepID=A0A7V1M271_CALAY|nr:cytochrome c oxidase subunit 3 family protein [Caldithrix abyssi]